MKLRFWQRCAKNFVMAQIAYLGLNDATRTPATKVRRRLCCLYHLVYILFD